MQQNHNNEEHLVIERPRAFTYQISAAFVKKVNEMLEIVFPSLMVPMEL